MTSARSRKIISAPLDALASRTVSFWVMGAWIALALVWLVPFQVSGQPAETVASIGFTWLPFRLTYAALLLTSTVCALVRLRSDVRRISRSREADRPLPASPMAIARGDLDAARAVLEGEQYGLVSAPGRVVASRYRASLLGGSVFHLAVAVLALGLAVHSSTFGSASFRLVEGQDSDSALSMVRSGTGRWQPLMSAASSVTLEEVRPAFHQDVFLFSGLDSTLLDERTGRRLEGSLSSPVWLDPFTQVSIQDFGYAPQVQVLNAKGEVVEEVISPLKLFPPGMQDSVRLPANGYTVSMIVYSDYGVADGRDVSLSYNLSNPRILVGIEQDYPVGMLRTRRLAVVGEAISGADLRVRIQDLRYFGVFRVWRSYGWPFMVVAAIMMLVGLSARFLFPFTRVTVWECADGLGIETRVDGRSREIVAADLASRLAGSITERSAERPADAGGPGATGGVEEDGSEVEEEL